MTDTEIMVTDQTSGEYVRTYERNVNSNAVNMQAVVPMRAGIQDWFTLYAQHLGDESITLPDGSTTVKHVLTRRPMPSDLEGVENESEDTGNSNTTSASVLSKSFYLDEKIIETLQLNGTVRFRATVAVKSSGTTDIAYIDSVKFSLYKIDSSGTSTQLGSTRTVSVDMQNNTTTYLEKSVVALLDLSSETLEAAQKLYAKIDIWGHTAGSTDTFDVRMSYDAGTSKTYVEIGVEE
ncbi:hypothetical protein DRN77_08130 [Methanosarcinales archaeon]|nr:MAG: hypothetical protein DRN77_08130 [Methanosarcinales archaeon]